MPTVTDSDLKELKDLINSRFDELDDKIQALDNRLNIYATKTDERLDNIKEGLTELRKQSEKQDNRLWVLISAMFLALLGLVFKMSFNA
jgi:DNA repair exonuclease SbcCD ATPase subunit